MRGGLPTELYMNEEMRRDNKLKNFEDDSCVDTLSCTVLGMLSQDPMRLSFGCHYYSQIYYWGYGFTGAGVLHAGGTFLLVLLIFIVYES